MSLHDDDRNNRWVHDDLFGAPAFGSIFLSIVLLIWGFILWVVQLFTRDRE